MAIPERIHERTSVAAMGELTADVSYDDKRNRLTSRSG